jgi:RNA polymerase sigma-70 factor, ECF subfamily
VNLPAPVATAVPGLEEVFRKYRDTVYRTCLRYLKEPGDAEDLTQEVFIKLHRKLPEFRGDSSLTTWIYRIAVNTCIDFLRTRRTFVEYGDEAALAMLEPNLAPGADAALAKVDLARLLDQTDDRTREILFLALAEGCSYTEVGELVGMTKWAVSKIVVRFQGRVQERKKAWFQELFSKEAK